jgi:hypothetical protein
MTILVLQRKKASKVMYGKDAFINGDGTLNVTSIQQVLALSKCIWRKRNRQNPESFTM